MVEHVWTCLNQLKNQEKQPEHIVILSGHHRFSHDRALEKMRAVLHDDWHVVWGKWRDNENSVNSQGAYHPYEELRQQPWVFTSPFAFQFSLWNKVNPHRLQDTDKAFLKSGSFQALGYVLCEQTLRNRFLNEVLFTLDDEMPLPFDQEGLWRDELMDKDLQQAIHHLANMDSPLLRIDQSFFKNHIYEFTQMAFLGERTLTRRDLVLATEGQVQNKQTKKAKEIIQTSSIAESLIQDPESQADLSEEERFEQLFDMDIEDAEMMAEAGHKQEALKLFEELLQHDDTNARVHTNIGVLNWDLEQTQIGMKHFLLAIRYDRDDRDPVMNCAAAWIELGRIDQAKSLCLDFLKRHPDDQPVQKLVNEIESLS
jgi:tetratricopeptide (TPR) repeat protein